VQIYKTKSFARFSKSERIGDVTLCAAIAKAERGLVDANLGEGLIKLRVARPGQGARSGYRMLIAFQPRQRAVFLFGFAKRELDNIADDQLATLHEMATMWLTANTVKIEQAVKDGLLIEVRNAG
jgi:hypothetical protein